jgi:hypothetical protein
MKMIMWGVRRHHMKWTGWVSKNLAIAILHPRVRFCYSAPHRRSCLLKHIITKIVHLETEVMLLKCILQYVDILEYGLQRVAQETWFWNGVGGKMKMTIRKLLSLIYSWANTFLTDVIATETVISLQLQMPYSYFT